MAYSYSDETPVEGAWQKYWGTGFKWTSKHLTPQQLRPFIYSYDTVATEAIERLDEIVPAPEGPMKPDDVKKPRGDMYEKIKEYAIKDEKIGRLWSEVCTVPDWVDWGQIERGQKVLFRYGGPAVIALTFVSLLGGMGAARATETLNRTGGFCTTVVRRRLLETMQHTLNVHRDLKSIRPEGDGFVNSVRVRLLHTAVRRRIMKMASQRPEYYNMAEYGVPINDLDSIGTINLFSTVLIWIGLPRQGIYLRREEIVDYLALWRYIAYVMGVPHNWMATPESAKVMMESVLVSETRPSAASANLANNIITGLKNHPPAYASHGFLCAQTHWLCGRELADELEIERPSLYHSALMLGQCLLFMTTCYINRSFRKLDEHHINFTRNAFYSVFLENKSRGGLGYQCKFVFKFIPKFDNVSTERGLATSGSGVRKLGIERTILLSLITFSALTGAVIWYGCILMAWVFGN